jgi:hypothetical protein
MYDKSKWPIIKMVSPTSISDEELIKTLGEFVDYITVQKKDERYGVILDLRDTKGITTQQRKMITDNMDGMKDYAILYCVGSAMVFDSPVLRGMLKAIFWITKPPYPTQVFKTLEDAEGWIQSKF